MQCIQPPPLTEDQLTAAIDGEAPTSVLQHLDRCPSCSQRFQQARQLEQALRSHLWRWDCPSAQALGEYHLQLLDSAQSTAVAQHLSICPHCEAELEDLRAFLKAAALPASPAQQRAAQPRIPRPGELIAALMPRSPALALRGSSAGQVTARADGLTIFLEFQPVASGFELTGQIIADSDQPEWEGALIELRQGGALADTAILDEFGEFKCTRLTQESVDLRISARTGRVVILDGLDLMRHAGEE